MNVDQIQDLLAVNWFDGLLVDSRHLSHVEARVDGILSRGINVMMDQPGLISDKGFTTTAHQLIELDAQSPGDSGISVQLNVTRPFQSVTPDGHLVIGIPNNESRFGVPTTTITATVSPDVGDADLLVCARQGRDPELKIQSRQGDDRPLDLDYPALDIVLVPQDVYRQGVTADFSDRVPIASLSTMDGQLLVDTDYIPPVVRLEQVQSFDAGILTSLNTLFHDLHRIATDLLQSAVVTSAQGDIGVDLISRRTEYATLSGLMLARIGLIRHIGRISAFRLLQEVVYPLALWWKQYYSRQFKQAVGMEHTPVKRVLDLANVLAEMSYSDVCVGSHDVLYKTKQFIEGLNNELGTVG